jgi:predicted ArsR family transcriptional regulator
MFLRSLRDIAKPQSVAVIGLLKRSTGMSVAEMAREMKMSYMGVKQHCVELEKKGFLDTWRRPKQIGRPEKTYRLTEKAGDLFPDAGCSVTLELLKDLQAIYGANAADKLLFSYFAKRTDAYLKKIKGATVTERAIAFAKLRDNEGYICDLSLEGEYGFSLVEYHNPLEKIGAQYPSVVRMEETLFSRVLQVPVRRSEERASGLARYVFRIDATPDMPEATSEESEEEGSASGTPASRAAVVGHVQLVG